MDSIVNTHPVRPLVDEITAKTLDPCAWRYVLNQDDLANFRLKVRSDVIGTWEIEPLPPTSYNHFYCQVEIVVSGCGFKSPFVSLRRLIGISRWMKIALPLPLLVEERYYSQLLEQQERITSHNLES